MVYFESWTIKAYFDKPLYLEGGDISIKASISQLTNGLLFDWLVVYYFVRSCVTRLGDLLDFGQLFKAYGNN